MWMRTETESATTVAHYRQIVMGMQSAEAMWMRTETGSATTAARCRRAVMGMHSTAAVRAAALLWDMEQAAAAVAGEAAIAIIDSIYALWYNVDTEGHCVNY